MTSTQWTVYSDGACAPRNPGPCGWGVICQNDQGLEIEAYGFVGPGTNQIAELTAAIEGLRLTPTGATVELVSDSQYVLKGISEWRKGWERRDWCNANGDPVANQTLWRQLFKEVDQRQIAVRWVRGHSGHPQNERTDALAARALETKASWNSHAG